MVIIDMADHKDVNWKRFVATQAARFSNLREPGLQVRFIDLSRSAVDQGKAWIILGAVVQK
jgi:hypothetical protein